MKKITAYLLVLLLLLNVMGYYGIFIGLKYKHNTNINERLDGYEAHQFESVTLKVPLTIPYYGDTQYERVSGEVEYEGEFYRLVKQKFEKDTLYIVCIKDAESKRIKQALADYVKNFSEHTSDSPSKTVPSFIKEYINSALSYSTASNGWNRKIQFGLTQQEVKTIPLTFISPPPEA